MTDGAPFTVRLGGNFRSGSPGVVVHPRTGETTALGEFENRGERRFTPPQSGEGRDWVLFLTARSRQ